MALQGMQNRNDVALSTKRITAEYPSPEIGKLCRKSQYHITDGADDLTERESPLMFRRMAGSPKRHCKHWDLSWVTIPRNPGHEIVCESKDIIPPVRGWKLLV